MKTFLLALQILISVMVVALILLQTSKGGLGAAFGGGEFYRTKRGAEKLVFTGTIIATIAFFLITILNLFV